MQKEMNQYLAHLVQNYRDWNKQGQPREMQFFVERGRNYAKIVSIAPMSSQRSVHSFVVIKETKGFKLGDILMAKSWNAPATNFARGNILTGNFERINWCGAS